MPMSWKSKFEQEVHDVVLKVFTDYGDFKIAVINMNLSTLFVISLI